MPLYNYRCTKCNHKFEHKKSMFDDDPVCSKCESEVKKVILPPKVIYRGPGFYSTDDGLKRDRRGRIDDVVPGAE